MKPEQIKNRRLLSNYLRTELDDLSKLVDNEYLLNNSCEHKFLDDDSIKSILAVHKFCIPKRNVHSGFREIYKPLNDPLVSCLKILNNRFNDLYMPPGNVHGFVKGRGIKSNADSHLEKKYILTIDLTKFFETISKNMVVKTMLEYGFSSEVSNWISNIVTINGYLVQGFHTSPTIANMVFKELDLKLNTLDENVNYTRYADDLYFSSDNELSILSKVEELIQNQGFEINKNKTKIMKRGGNQYVTGLTVFDGEYARISRRKKRQIRLEAYYISKYGYKGHILNRLNYTVEQYDSVLEIRNEVDNLITYESNKINGWLVFVNGIEPKYSKKCVQVLTDS